MTVTLIYLQAIRKAAGTERETVELAAGATAGDALSRAVVRHPQLEAWRPSLLIAVNEIWAAPEEALKEGDEVALMPPVSGG